MKALLLTIMCIILAFFAFVGISESAEVTVEFAWDPHDKLPVIDGTEVPQTPWEHLRLYQKTGEVLPWPDDSVATILQSYTGNNSQPINFEYTFDSPDGQAVTYYWMIRAFNSTLPVEEQLSPASNTVSKTIDLTPLESFTFTVTYDANENSLIFSWTPVGTRAISWKIYTSETSGGPYAELQEVNSSGSVTMPAGSLFPAGENTTRYFTMVAFGEYGVHSPDAAEQSVTVNRRPIQQPMNFTIILE